MEIHLKTIGTLLTFLAILHVGFPSYFKWKKELASLSLINRQMMQTHTFFIALVVAMNGILCLHSPSQLIETELGKTISFGFGIFWVLRFIFQLFVYSPKLWKNKKFETTIHIVFSVFWAYMSFVFLYIALA